MSSVKQTWQEDAHSRRTDIMSAISIFRAMTFLSLSLRFSSNVTTALNASTATVCAIRLTIFKEKMAKSTCDERMQLCDFV